MDQIESDEQSHVIVKDFLGFTGNVIERFNSKLMITESYSSNITSFETLTVCETEAIYSKLLD